MRKQEKTPRHDVPWKRGRLERQVLSDGTVRYIVVPPEFRMKCGPVPTDVREALLVAGKNLRLRLDELNAYLTEQLLPSGAEPDTLLYRSKFSHFEAIEQEYRRVCDVLARRIPPARGDFIAGEKHADQGKRSQKKAQTIDGEDYWSGNAE